MRVLVTGASGMLGHKLLQLLPTKLPLVIGSIRGRRSDEPFRRVPMFHSERVLEGFDAADITGARERLRALRPEVVVNCVGIVKQRTEAANAVASITINSLLPHVIADVCAEWGGRVIHVSTDCVFSGSRGAYTEEDMPDAIDLYGRTKALGEVASENALTLRTSIIGRELRNQASLLEWFLSNDGKTVKGFTRAIYSGVTTNHLASLIATLILEHPRLSGLYQVVAEPIAKYDLLVRLREAFGLRMEVLPDHAFHCDRSMSGAKLEKAIGYRAPNWSQLIAELASDRTPYEEWRTSV